MAVVLCSLSAIFAADVGSLSANSERLTKLDVGPIAVQIHQPPPHCPLSDVVEVAVVLSAPSGVEIGWPLYAAGGGAKVLEERKDGPDKVGRFLLRRWTLRLEPMQLGLLHLGAAKIRYRDAGGSWETEEIPLGSTTITPGPTSSDDPASLRPIPSLPPEPRSFWSGALIWGGVGLGLLAIALFAWRSLKPKAEATRVDVGALDSWLELEQAAQAGSKEPRELVQSATDLVREHLERRFGRPARRQSTPELLSDPALLELLDADRRRALSEFLATADVEKFGRRPPTLEEARQCIRQGREILSAGSST